MPVKVLTKASSMVGRESVLVPNVQKTDKTLEIHPSLRQAAAFYNSDYMVEAYNEQVIQR